MHPAQCRRSLDTEGDEKVILEAGDQFEIMGFKYDRRPKYYLEGQRWVYDLIECWNWKEGGFLPYDGTWQDQPNFVLEGMSFIDHLSQEKASKAHEASMNKMKASKGKNGRK